MKLITLFVLICFHSVVLKAEELPQNEILPEEKLSSTTISKVPNDQVFIVDTLRLIGAGDAEIVLDEATKEIVIAIGLTGAGKTTMTKFIANPETLEAYETTQTFLIRDKEKTISEKSTIVSKTIFPERLLDPSTKCVFYDMPGFSDTRNTSIEIANAWFMKKVANHASSVKILFVVGHSTVKAGEHRDIFLKLLTHATEYIKEPKKFSDAISLVVSKVGIRRNKNVEDVIEDIADFLITVKSNLGEVSTDSEKQRRASDLIDAFLTKGSDGSYSKISFFRQPKAAGPLTEIPEVMAQRSHMKQVIENNTVFVNSSPDDFGISVSPGGQLLSLNLTRITNDKITSVILSIQDKIESHYTAVSRSPLTEVGSYVKGFKKLEIIPEVLQHLFVRNEFLQQLSGLLTNLSLPIISSDITELGNLGTNLQFFEDLTGQQLPFNSKEWARPIKTAIQTVQNKIDQKLTELNNHVLQRISLIVTQFENYFTDNLNNPQVDQSILTGEMQNFSQALKIFGDNVLQKSQSFNDFSSQLETFLRPYDRSFEMMLSQDIEIEGKNCQHISPLKLQQWLLPFKVLRKHIQSKRQALEVQIHGAKLDQEFEIASNELTILENNANEQLNNIKLETINFQIQSENLRTVRNAKRAHEEENCMAKSKVSSSLHTQNMQQERESQTQSKSSTQLEIDHERPKSYSLQAACQHLLNDFQSKMSQERAEHKANLENIQKSGDNQDAEARETHKHRSDHQCGLCNQNLQHEEKSCTQQLALLRETIQYNQSVWDEKIRESDSDCDDRKLVATQNCTFQKTSLQKSVELKSKHLTDYQQINQTVCRDAQVIVRADCDSQVGRIQSETLQLQKSKQEELDQLEKSCKMRRSVNEVINDKELDEWRERIDIVKRDAAFICNQQHMNVTKVLESNVIEITMYTTMAQDSELYQLS